MNNKEKMLYNIGHRSASCHFTWISSYNWKG